MCCDCKLFEKLTLGYLISKKKKRKKKKSIFFFIQNRKNNFVEIQFMFVKKKCVQLWSSPFEHLGNETEASKKIYI